MRDMLIELLKQINFDYCDECCYAFEDGYKSAPDFAEFFADRLIAEGVIVPPCKVGDTVYYINGAYYNSAKQTVRPIEVTEISWKCDRSGKNLGFALIANGTRYKFSSIGKTVFLTREEAEKALTKRRIENDR